METALFLLPSFYILTVWDVLERSRGFVMNNLSISPSSSSSFMQPGNKMFPHRGGRGLSPAELFIPTRVEVAACLATRAWDEQKRGRGRETIYLHGRERERGRHDGVWTLAWPASGSRPAEGPDRDSAGKVLQQQVQTRTRILPSTDPPDHERVPITNMTSCCRYGRRVSK